MYMKFASDIRSENRGSGLAGSQLWLRIAWCKGQMYQYWQNDNYWCFQILKTDKCLDISRIGSSDDLELRFMANSC